MTGLRSWTPHLEAYIRRRKAHRESRIVIREDRHKIRYELPQRWQITAAYSQLASIIPRISWNMPVNAVYRKYKLPLHCHDPARSCIEAC